ncbi:MAG: HTH-type transcriptional regulator Hpr [Candidatus Izimaplasma bacterium HR2]|nr:MAG: HTH-type transcriptional regulator Hpr [Candidatus Izimaplasma bacterium HR2]
MSTAKKVINELLVEVFNHILSIEGSKLKERGVKISMNEMHVLEAIQKTDYPAMSNIARRLRVTVGTLTTSVNRLVEKGYATRKREEEDKRKVIISLTNKAREALKIHEEFHEEMLDALFEDMNLAEDEVLLQSLENLSEYFKNKY